MYSVSASKYYPYSLVLFVVDIKKSKYIYAAGMMLPAEVALKFHLKALIFKIYFRRNPQHPCTLCILNYYLVLTTRYLLHDINTAAVSINVLIL